MTYTFLGPPRIAHVLCFPNGNVAVFDQYDRQMPEYQGNRDALPRIRAAIAANNWEVEWRGEQYYRVRATTEIAADEPHAGNFQ
jgi:hypothetical protein